MIGPYHEPTVKLEVEVMEPEFSVTKEVVESMRKEGVKVRLHCHVDRIKIIIIIIITPRLLLLITEPQLEKIFCICSLHFI